MLSLNKVTAMILFFVSVTCDYAPVSMIHAQVGNVSLGPVADKDSFTVHWIRGGSQPVRLGGGRFQ